ncbi:MAG TPA: glycosyltransferase family 2 protein [bacterium]|nr:glycosyltransferase family 2 protein [bacterium]
MIEDALIVVPAFNEAAVIGDTLHELLAVARYVLVVDDGSTDGTDRAARAAGAQVLRLGANLNYGGALQAGFRYAARRSSLPYVVTFDADGQHDPAHLDALLGPLREGRGDYVLGSRFQGGRAPSLPRSRDLGIRLFARAASLAVGFRVTDPTTGMAAMTREVSRVFLLDLFPQDYPDADVIIMLSRMGFKIIEVPVKMRPSHSGKSMHSGLIRPLYYIAKMSVSMIHLATRGDLREKRKEASIAA